MEDSVVVVLVVAVVDTLDRVSLERKRPLTLPLLREVLKLLEADPALRGR